MSGFNLSKYKRGEDYDPDQNKSTTSNKQSRFRRSSKESEPKIKVHRKSLSFFSQKLKKGTVGTGYSEYALKSNGLIF